MKVILTCMFSLLIATFASHAMEMEKPWYGAERDIGTINFQFEQINDGELVQQAMPILFPAVGGDQTVYTNHDGMRKTLLTIEMGNSIKTALKSFQECDKGSAEQERIGRELFNAASGIEDRLVLLGTKEKLPNFFETIATMKMLAKNISVYKEPKRSIYAGIPSPEFSAECARSLALASASALNVTTGGAKGIGHFRKMVTKGRIPEPADFPIEGFMSEFALSLAGVPVNKYLGVSPVTAFDTKTNTLYVQLQFSTSITPATFKRKPLNLSFVVDISGSMGDRDDTQKTRLEWAKTVIDMAIANMNQDDMVSIVVFGDKVETILSPTNVTDDNRNAIKNSYAALTTRGATDVFIGLERGFALVDKNRFSNGENRIILLSDAGDNTGYGTEEKLLRLISDNASEENPIGLTAIGMGLDFNEKLIHSISMSKGGNYLFVQSGQEMVSFFEEFSFLVSPVAYNFKANVMLNRGFKANLVRAYGIPMKDGEPLGDILNVRSVFFAGKSGGAMVLQYQLEK